MPASIEFTKFETVTYKSTIEFTELFCDSYVCCIALMQGSNYCLQFFSAKVHGWIVRKKYCSL